VILNMDSKVKKKSSQESKHTKMEVNGNKLAQLILYL
jgi:hypothetical protein